MYQIMASLLLFLRALLVKKEDGVLDIEDHHAVLRPDNCTESTENEKFMSTSICAGDEEAWKISECLAWS